MLGVLTAESRDHGTMQRVTVTGTFAGSNRADIYRSLLLQVGQQVGTGPIVTTFFYCEPVEERS